MGSILSLMGFCFFALIAASWVFGTEPVLVLMLLLTLVIAGSFGGRK